MKENFPTLPPRGRYGRYLERELERDLEPEEERDLDRELFEDLDEEEEEEELLLPEAERENFPRLFFFFRPGDFNRASSFSCTPPKRLINQSSAGTVMVVLYRYHN